MSKTKYIKSDYLNHKNIYLNSSNNELICGKNSQEVLPENIILQKVMVLNRVKDKIQMNEAYK